MFPEGRILDFLIVGVIALIVVGPKDLPILMRKVGRFVAHMRGMAAEFRASFDEMARQSELDELRKEVEALRTGQPLKAAVGLEGEGDVQTVFDDIHASLRESQAQMHPMSPQYPSSVEVAAGPEPPEPAPVDGRPPEVTAAPGGEPAAPQSAAPQPAEPQSAAPQSPAPAAPKAAEPAVRAEP
jgi:sec-independent protein translocase protein TatB